jgi:methylglutaconyl-CoA hydratase
VKIFLEDQGRQDVGLVQNVHLGPANGQSIGYLPHMSTHADALATSGAEGDVSLAVDEGVGTIEFSHPKGNSLPGELLRRLAGGIQTLAEDDAARVIVLGSGGTGPFCAGASFDELVTISSEEEGEEFFSGFARVILAMINAPKFVLVRVHGRAAGGGVGIAAASDYTFAVKSAAVKLSELSVGIGPFVVGPVIERRVGCGPFSALAVDTDWRDAVWCERHGLFARVFDDVDSMDAALGLLAGALAASNPAAMAAMKRTFWAGTEEWESLLASRARVSGALVLSDYTRAAIARFRKR